MIRNPPVGAGGAPTLPTFVSGQFGLNPLTDILLPGASTWSAWTSLGTLTAAIDELAFTAIFESSSRALALELRTGGSTVIVDRFVSQNLGTGEPVGVPLPIRIPAGLLEARVASNVDDVSRGVSLSVFGVQSSVPETATVIEPITPFNLAALLTTGTTDIFMTEGPGAWTNIGSPLAADAKGLIFTAQNGGRFSGKTAGPVVIQFSIDGVNPISSTVVGQTSAVFIASCRRIRHQIPSGTQLRARAYMPVPVDNLDDRTNICVSIIR